MKSSVIKFPKKSYYTVTYLCCAEIAENDLCAAKLINFFVSWHDYKLSNQSRIICQNQLAKQDGATDLQDTSLLQHHTTEQLIEGLIGEYAKHNINKALQILDRKGFVTIHKNPNPRYKGDRTKHFLVHPETIQAELDRWEQNAKSASKQKDDFADYPTEMEDHSTEMEDHSTEMVNHYQDTFHDSCQYPFQKENTPKPPNFQTDKSGGTFFREENSELISPKIPQQEAPRKEDSELVLEDCPQKEAQPLVRESDRARKEIIAPSLVQPPKPNLGPPQPPQCSITEVTTETTSPKRLGSHGTDREDATIVNWGIDNSLWGSKQELIAFKVALVDYIPLAAKFNWVTAPIPYVRSLLKKASQGEDDAKATLTEIWSQYTPQGGIALPKASWMSLDERNQRQYSHWINNDCRWDWQRESIPDWIDKVLYQPESKPCKEMWAIWLQDRQHDAEREARRAKEAADRERQRAENQAQYDANPLTDEDVVLIQSRLKEMQDKLAAKKAAERNRRGNIDFWQIGSHSE